MASSGKKRTTFAKLAREQKLRERRQDKQAKKNARKRAEDVELAPLNDREAVQ
jgi:hypothetical protein